MWLHRRFCTAQYRLVHRSRLRVTKKSIKSIVKRTMFSFTSQWTKHTTEWTKLFETDFWKSMGNLKIPAVDRMR